MATLTVILCNYNHAAYIDRAIAAILNQSRPPDELIIVDDASTDHSLQVIEPWAEKNPRVQLLRNEENLGFHGSARRAIDAATGEYLYSAAADDYVLPGFFAAVMDCCERFPTAPVASAKVVTALPDGTRVRTDGYPRFHEAIFLTPARYLDECLRPEAPTHSLSSATIYRREALLSIGGWKTELGSWADTFAIRALGLKDGFCYIPHESVVWVIQPEGISQSTGRNSIRALQQIERAARLMRLSEFASVFPQDYVRDWEQSMRTALMRQQLQPIMDAYQTVQDECRRTGERATWSERIVLAIVRRSMTACYLAVFHLLQRIVRREFRQQQAQARDHV